MEFPLTVKAIIRRGDRILILKRSEKDDHKPGVWETPGGGIDRKESPQEALKREVQEETGLEVNVGAPFNVFTFQKDTGEYKVGITFLCDYVSGEVVLSEEHEDFQFIDPALFPSFPSIPSLYSEIEEYARQYA